MEMRTVALFQREPRHRTGSRPRRDPRARSAIAPRPPAASGTTVHGAKASGPDGPRPPS